MPVIDMPATAANIGRMMGAAGVTAADVAEAMGFTTRNAVYRWLRGDTLPTLDNMVILADLLGAGVDDILVLTRR